MNIPELTPEGDLPPNHPLVLEALKGIIGGPIAELRATVDKNITEQSIGLRAGKIDYNSILPMANGNHNNHNDFNQTNHIANNILNQIAPVQYNAPSPQPISQVVQLNQPIVQHQQTQAPVDPNQMELGLFKQPEVTDIHKKLFDIERKLDIIIKHVKNNKN